MPTVRFVPSTYSLSNTSYFSVSNASNCYTNVDSTNYATFQTTNSSTSSRYVYLKGFDFSQVPSGSIITSIAIKVKGYESGANTGASYAPRLCNNTSTISNVSAASENFGTSAKTITVPHGDLTWDDLTGYGSNLAIRLDARRSSRNTASYLYIYGAEIEVTYTLPVYHDVTVTNNTGATVSPTGTTSVLEGDSFTAATDTLTGITVTDNGTDVTNQFVQASDGSLSQTAESFTTSLSASGANFYTSSSSTGNYFSYAVGHTAEAPSYTSASATYVKDGGSNTATGWAKYSFDFSAIPAGANITGVSVKCYGFTESTTHDSTHKANITLHSGDTTKGSEQYFTSTSNSVITLSNVGTWTRSELQSAELWFEVAYYGGGIFGITWTVTYESDGYVYTISSVAADHTIVFSSGGSQPTLYVKESGTWKQVQRAYKKQNGSWIQVAVDQAFTSGTNYVHG